MNKSSTRRQTPKLSKSSFAAGLQCLKRLYLESYHRELLPPIPESRQALFDTGHRVGEMAQGLYPGGVLMEQDHFHINEAIAVTERLLNGPPVPAIYEAGFIFDDVRVRIDILARAGRSRHDLIEVKSTTGLKEEHIPDVAIQMYVLEGSGVKLGRARLAHLNKDYVYPGGDYDVHQLFAVKDVTEKVREYQSEIPGVLESMREALRESELPDVSPGRHCTSPYECPFLEYCNGGGPEHPVSDLPKAGPRLLAMLKEAGIEDIRDIPVGFPGLNPRQQRVRDCVLNNRVYLDSAVRRHLKRLEYPVHFLDFETFNPAVPIYVGTRPYQAIPFQWSDHILAPDGGLRHEEFLHDGSDDPREQLARSLVETLGASGSIVVYSGFEETRIREMAEALPHLSSDLLALVNGRIVDLLPIVREHCYHPDFHGSFSLKAVLPALVPNLGYDDLAITDGQAASLAYSEIIDPATLEDRRRELRADLLLYCGRDTEAMVRLVERLWRA